MKKVAGNKTRMIVLDRHIQAINNWWADRSFWKAYCHDCREYKFQSFNHDEVLKAAAIHLHLHQHNVEVTDGNNDKR